MIKFGGDFPIGNLEERNARTAVTVLVMQDRLDIVITKLNSVW